jgi:hypothetical protein
VTRLGYFLFAPIGTLFIFGNFLKITEVDQIWVTFSTIPVMYNVFFKYVGRATFWETFSQTRPVTLASSHQSERRRLKDHFVVSMLVHTYVPGYGGKRKKALENLQYLLIHLIYDCRETIETFGVPSNKTTLAM